MMGRESIKDARERMRKWRSMRGGLPEIIPTPQSNKENLLAELGESQRARTVGRALDDAREEHKEGVRETNLLGLGVEVNEWALPNEEHK